MWHVHAKIWDVASTAAAPKQFFVMWLDTSPAWKKGGSISIMKQRVYADFSWVHKNGLVHKMYPTASLVQVGEDPTLCAQGCGHWNKQQPKKMSLQQKPRVSRDRLEGHLSVTVILMATISGCYISIGHLDGHESSMLAWQPFTSSQPLQPRRRTQEMRTTS